MTTPDTPPTGPHPPQLPKPIGFAAGLGVGFLLWMIIGLATQNLALGLVFGLLPGVAIGVGLQLTARR